MECFEINVFSKERGKGQIWISQNAFVEYVRPSDSMELFRKGPESLRINDLLLIVEENQQNSIFDRLVEDSSNNPKMQYITAYRNTWRKAISVLSAKFQMHDGKPDYNSILASLQKAGSKITTTKTIQNWISDIVIGPENISSIVAVGKVSGVVELSHKAKEFNKNFSKIRSLHRIIGRRVASIIRKTFELVVSKKNIETKDNLQHYLSVPLDEIVNAIETVEVIADVKKIKEKIDPCLVGKFFKIE